MSKTTTNALEELASQFATTERLALKCPDLKAQLFAQPCTLEDNLRLVSISEEKDPTARANGMARFLVDKVETEEGERAFRNCMNKPAVEVLRTMVKPSLLFGLFSQIAGSANTAATEELAGK
ncbi:hypothetical protein [Roseibacillus ishigakijimensis]|uniref:Uncharacterized protein n=1 Tax=Roseibacillus ishigakijimensis TaxID=454146 RepID=A0A934VND7_9BACT|nr:hypothetical protein [Roseibacillus ishigakijimensis]MBK1835006.1 hypothetical protein [Roseibacillus ishigakijimensis]